MADAPPAPRAPPPRPRVPPPQQAAPAATLSAAAESFRMPPAAEPVPGPAASKQKAGRGAGRGGGGRSAGRGDGRGEGRGSGRGSGRGGGGRGRGQLDWRAELDEEDVCPITLSPLLELSAPPFQLDGTSRFDGKALYDYLHASMVFQNPLTRAPITREQCELLEAHCARHRLLPKPGKREAPRPTLIQRFDEAVSAAAAAAYAGTAEALAAERARVSAALLQSFYFAGARPAAASAPRAPRQPRAAAAQAEGNLWMVDDDEQLARGLSRSEAEARQARDAAAARRVAAPTAPDHFPALLPAPAPPPRPPPPAQPAAARPLPSWWSLAAPTAAQPTVKRPSHLAAGTMPVFNSSGGIDGRPASASGAPAPVFDEDAAAARKRQLAAAFGVSNPDKRPSCFADSAVAAFSAETMGIARAEPAFVLDLEARFDAALRGGVKRVSLPAMPRGKRRVAHELGALYHILTQSYGEGANRHIDLFVVPQMSAPPSIRLSDAALSSAPPPAAAASSFLPIFFHDVAPDTDISALLSAWEGQFSLMSETAGEAVALFSTPRARDEARDRLGGGVRGRFTVTVPPAAEEAPQSKPAAARPKADAWGDEEPARPAARGAKAAPRSWESIAAAPAPPKPANVWSVLGDDGAGEEEEEEGSEESDEDEDEEAAESEQADGAGECT